MVTSFAFGFFPSNGAVDDVEACLTEIKKDQLELSHVSRENDKQRFSLSCLRPVLQVLVD
jgi:hypothetical protein